MDYMRIKNMIVKGVFRRLSPEEKLSRVFTTKQWKDNINVIPTIKHLEELCKIVEKWDSIDSTSTKHLAILCNYNESIYDLFTKYDKLTTSKKKARTIESYCLYYGEKQGRIEYEKYKKKLSDAQIRRYSIIDNYTKRKNSQFCKEYWMAKGYDEDEAIKIISVYQSKISKNFHSSKKKSYYKTKNPLCKEYWMAKGYDEDEAIYLTKPYIDNFKLTKQNYIKRYGNEEGIKKWNNLIKRRSYSFSKYLKSNNGIYGKASKESLQYFIPLYKILRKDYNIQRDDIFIGVRGSKEWYLAYGNTYYYRYDFTIKSKKVIIEYNNLRWHPHPDRMTKEDWDSWYIHGMTAYDKYEYDRIKYQTAINRGYHLLVIWNNDGYDYNMNMIKRFIDEHI